jgi:hypothetical protein
MKIFSVLALMLISVASFAYAQDEITPITVSVDIKAGNCINPINPNGASENRGLFSFDIMGTTDFDVAQIDPESIRITREDVDGEVEPIRWSYRDVGEPSEGELCDCESPEKDGQIDLVMKAYRAEIVEDLELYEVAGETILLTIIGNLKDEFGGTPIVGEDCVRVLKSVSKEKKK